MRTVKYLSLIPVALLVTWGAVRLSLLTGAPSTARTIAATPNVAVSPQYDTAHVYVAPVDFDRFVASLVATFGGTTSKQGVFTVTPTPSSTMSQLVLTPAGTVSVFGFKTPIPYPFGLERTGYLVKDLDEAVRVARATGTDVLVSPFNDPNRTLGNRLDRLSSRGGGGRSNGVPHDVHPPHHWASHAFGVDAGLLLVKTAVAMCQNQDRRSVTKGCCYALAFPRFRRISRNN